METKRSTQSVISKLMGLDESPQQPVQKRQRVLSETYLQRAASVGFRKKLLFHQSSSRKNTEKKHELKDAVERVVPNKDQEVQTGKANLHSTDQKKDLWRLKSTDVKCCLEDEDLQCQRNFDDVVKFPYLKGKYIPKYKREQGGLFSTSLREMQTLPPHLQSRKFNHMKNRTISRNILNKSQGKMLKFSGSQLNLKDRALFSPSPIPSKPNDLKADGAARLVCSPTPTRVPYSDARKNRGYGMFSSPVSSDGKRQNIPPFPHPGKFHVALKEKNKMIGSFQKVVPVCNHEKLSSREPASITINYDPRNQFCSDNAVTNPSTPLDVYSGNGRDQKHVGSLSTYGYSLECFKACRGQKKGSDDKAVCDNWHMKKYKQSVTRVLQQKPQDHNKKNGLEIKIPEACGKNSVYFPCLDIKDKRELELGDRIIVNMVADEKIKLLNGNLGSSKTQQFNQACINITKNDNSFTYSQDDSTQQDKFIACGEECSVSSGFSGTDLDSIASLEVYQQSPDSVLESYHSRFQEVSADLYGLKKQLELFKSEPSETSEIVVSSDEDNGEVSLSRSIENDNLLRHFRVEESRDFSYVVDVLTEAGIVTRNLDMACETWHAPDCPIGLSVFETLEKKYGEQINWKRSDRRLLFDRINQGLLEILLPCLGMPTWARAVSDRLHGKSNEAIEEELWLLLVNQGKEAPKYLSDKVIGKYSRWSTLGEDTELVGIEIEKMIIEELITEIVSI